jgi:hypothetical protein
MVAHACHVDQGGAVQGNYAVTRTDTWSFTGAAGDWAIGGIPLVPAVALDAERPAGRRCTRRPRAGRRHHRRNDECS